MVFLHQMADQQEKISGNVFDLQILRRIFRFVKSYSDKKYQDLKLSIFLGPLVYQSDEAKRLLTEMEHEFYEGDVFLYELDQKTSELKNIDIFFYYVDQRNNKLFDVV